MLKRLFSRLTLKAALTGMGAHSAMTTGIAMTDLLRLTQWLSPAFPVGSYAYSHGLEQAILQGDICDAESLYDWLDGLLEFGSGRNDAILLSLTLRQVHSDQQLADLAQALCSSQERWQESIDQGSAFVQTTNALLGTDYTPIVYPVAVGRVARHLELSDADIIALYLHSFVANLVSAAVRFVPLGQTDGQSVQSRCHDMIKTVAEVALVAEISDLGGCAFGSDFAALAHETLETRVFRT